jgi:hypothetical protein
MSEFKKAIEKMIELLPDWAQGKPIKLLANQELVFRKDPDAKLQIKMIRCNLCGECCLQVPENYLQFGTNGEGRCNKLNKDGTCDAGHQKPFACLDDPPESEFDDLNCCIRYQK